jgi:hypothetical protein
LCDPIEKNDMDGNVTCRGERSVFNVLMGKPEGKTPLGILRHRWRDINMDLQEVGWRHGLH